ncbi:phosphotransferase family protein [Nocardioides solisilvae]|uniref:phosphotransferase family protein n=1 Tax=Nocardioides solisilvae TaxID=1542435 RepID=UPI000D74C15F|nr:phosphotransferase [Nocardioides solisilvae]
MTALPAPGPYPAPPDATARRLHWQFLPPGVRAWVERRCGSPVVEALSQDAGFTPGFASVLVCADGSRHFVKAASPKAQRVFADSYREEARKLAALPDGIPAPRLVALLDDDWVVLVLEHQEGVNPPRPWTPAHLDATLDALESVAAVTTPVPPALALDPFVVETADWPAHWDVVRERRPDLPHLDEAQALAAAHAAATDGDTLVHTDVRADNVLVDPEGRAWICDWNWPVRGASWLDSLLALVGPRGDGLDVEGVIATRPLLRDVPAEHVDSFLALVTGFFLRMGGEAVPPTSPWLRAHQAWQGEVCWQWLAERRGWAVAGGTGRDESRDE